MAPFMPGPSKRLAITAEIIIKDKRNVAFRNLGPFMLVDKPTETWASMGRLAIMLSCVLFMFET
jgi:hypothetical protein